MASLARAYLLGSLLYGCGEPGSEPQDENVSSVEQAIVNGTLVSNPSSQGTVAVYHQYVRPCSGTLIRKQWVLTARHCLTFDGEVQGPLIAPSQVVVVRTASPGLLPPPTGGNAAKQLIADIGYDIALIRLTSEMSSPVGLWNGNTSQLLGLSVRAMGYGRVVDGGDDEVENGTTGAGTLRMADLTVSEVFSDGFRILPNASGQYTWVGDSGGPSFRLTDMLGRNLTGVAGVHETGGSTGGIDGSVATLRNWIKRKQFVRGDLDHDGRSDIALTGATSFGSVHVARANGSGGFNPQSWAGVNLTSWTATAGAKTVAGDFDGDGYGDLAVTGVPGWTGIGVGYNVPDSQAFWALSGQVANFPGWAATAGVKALSGDFDGDGRDDIALTGGAGWLSIPVAFSRGFALFSVTNAVVASFPSWAASANVKALSGDFDGDGRDDIALTGVAGWLSIPVAFSNGDGTFTVSNLSTSSFPAAAAQAGAKVVAGDFDGDGRDDLALTGAVGGTTIMAALSKGDGTFNVVSQTVPNFPSWAATAGAKAVSGDYNGDGRDDIALTGVAGWASVPVAFAVGGGAFLVVNPSVATFPGLAATAGAKPLSGHQAM